MNQRSLLILSHQGFSFVEDLVTLAKRFGFTSVILSSKIRGESSERHEQLKSLAAVFRETETPALTSADVASFLKEIPAPSACITVWEGYRLLMAEANEGLGARDERQDVLRLLMDKYEMRQKLLQLGLSAAQTRLISAGTKLNSVAPLFIKPRRGIGSFGAFKWDGQPLEEKLNGLLEQMRSDLDYAGIFPDAPEFLAEEEIRGTEYSFEVIVADGCPHVLAIHEKLDLSEEHGAVLEKACASPPISLDQEGLEQASTYISRVLAGLGVRTGCYHVEARYSDDRKSWDVIEVNPRIGGAFIFQSTRWVSGYCPLRLWLETLLGWEIPDLPPSLPCKGQSFFRVYFGEPGKTICAMTTSSQIKAPDVFKQIVKSGAVLPLSSREIFLGQALWLMPMDVPAEEIEQLSNSSKNFFEVTYAS